MIRPKLVKKLFAAFLALISLVLLSAAIYLYLKPKPKIEDKFVVEPISTPVQNSVFEQLATDTGDKNAEESETQNETIEKLTFEVPEKYEITQKTHIYQTFNNCGPATLSMILSYYGINASQEDLGQEMRPYQHPKGDNDDKTIFTHEFTSWAKSKGEGKGLHVVNLPNGSIDLLKLFISNDIPVVVKMWLNTKEDIGHFIVARGYDDSKQVILKDDSYYGPNKRVDYYDFLSMWQSFNYSYIVLYSEDQASIVESILGNEINEKTAWRNAAEKAEKEADLDPNNVYPIFNLSVAHYHLGNYEKSIEYFEQVESNLPRRMLWYQIEPILSYKEVGNFDRVHKLIINILNDNNIAFSELYMIKGDIYLEQGKVEEAKKEYEKALLYNKNFTPAIDALNTL